MSWIKKSHIYLPSGSLPWSKTHAQIPTPIKLNKETLRIFFSTRNNEGITQAGYIDVDIDQPEIIKDIAQEPIIKIGSHGLDDDSGAMPFSIVKTDTNYLFYLST